MFAKIFDSIYDGTLAEHWQALVTFQQLMILSNAEGVVDLTPAAISRRTGIPREIIDAGIAHLEQPDPQSRSAVMEGVRISRLDQHRTWGWFIVNHAHYRAIQNAEEKREKDRIRIAKKRDTKRQPATDDDMSQGVAGCREASQEVANVAYTEADTEAQREGDDAGAGTHVVDERPPASHPPDPPGQLGAAGSVTCELPPGTAPDAWRDWLEQLTADGKASYVRIRNASMQLWTVAKSGHDPTKVLRSAIARGHRDLLAVAADLKPSTQQSTTGGTHAARRESVAERAERRGEEALQRLGAECAIAEDDSGTDP